MRSSKSRSRNKSNRQRTLGNIVNRVFDSSGPEGKVRGTPQQIIDKYLTLARDAQLSNDRVAEQAFLQHAEHYTRMLGEAQREMAERQQQYHQNQRQNGDDETGQPREGGQNGRDYVDRGGRDQPRRQDSPAAPESSAAPVAQPVAAPVARPAAAPAPEAAEPEHAAEPAVTVETASDAEPAAPVRRGRGRPRRTPLPEAQAESLPDAVSLGDGETSAPVETPETEATAKPRRPRTPRSATGRTRRNAAGTETAEAAGEAGTNPAENGTGEG
ncbi:DUF4167 domain-containing protein [Paracoccus marinaquae]|uniref:DUF4167 domain-containing protein n=1 Tax=Paracoccus marinaquae TaxID=2841926 RepID=A0ABS6AHM6_9RHOB|nr:DUF4167 domain-containing protein [Paracoccus marinaquae]MBU3028866.1 DUF4167 domain-containing protein [Paracoccus marinaquae]